MDRHPSGDAMTARRDLLPNRRASQPFGFEHRGVRHTATISVLPNGRLAEIFIDSLKPSAIAEHANHAAVLASLLLQNGVTAAVIRHSISEPLVTALAKVERGQS